MRSRSHRGSVLVLVVLVLSAAAVLVAAAEAMAIAGYRESVTRFRHAAALLAARGGVHYTVGYLGALGQPAEIFSSDPDSVSFYKDRQSGDTHPDAGGTLRTGWFVASTPHPSSAGSGTGPSVWGVQSEQARLPLSAFPLDDTGNRTKSYQYVLPSIGSKIGAYVDAVQHSTTDPKNRQMVVFRHPYELLMLDGITRAHLLGNDTNDNHVHDPFESDPASGIGPAPPQDCQDLDRGLADLVTTFGDGKLDIYRTFQISGIHASAYLWQFPPDFVINVSRYASGNRPPLAAIPGNDDWAGFASRNLTDEPSCFRVSVYGTYDGVPMGHVEVVTSHMQEQDRSQDWFSIACYRED